MRAPAKTLHNRLGTKEMTDRHVISVIGIYVHTYIERREETISSKN